MSTEIPTEPPIASRGRSQPEAMVDEAKERAGQRIKEARSRIVQAIKNGNLLDLESAIDSLAKHELRMSLLDPL